MHAPLESCANRLQAEEVLPDQQEQEQMAPEDEWPSTLSTQARSSQDTGAGDGAVDNSQSACTRCGELGWLTHLHAAEDVSKHKVVPVVSCMHIQWAGMCCLSRPLHCTGLAQQ